MRRDVRLLKDARPFGTPLKKFAQQMVDENTDLAQAAKGWLERKNSPPNREATAVYKAGTDKQTRRQRPSKRWRRR